MVYLVSIIIEWRSHRDNNTLSGRQPEWPERRSLQINHTADTIYTDMNYI